MEPAQTRIVFMGSPEFAVPSLRSLSAAGYLMALVVTQPDRPAGRGGRVTLPPVKVAALASGIEVLQPSRLRDDATFERVAAANADVFVVAAYGRIIPERMLALPSRGSLNVHASLLPRWRGASPIAAAIAAGDAETGVSIMEVVARMDAGPVVARRSLPVAPADTTGTLGTRLAEHGAALLIETLPGWFDRSVAAEPQDESAATYCALVKKEDGHLRRSMTAVEAERAVRACDPWPGAYVVYRGQRLGVWKASVVDDPPAGPPGTLSVVGRRPVVAFTSGSLALDEVQRPGARRVPADAFLNGERATLPPTVELA